MSRSRIERLDLGDHLREILGIDPTDPYQSRNVAGCQKRQVVEKPLHRRVETIAVAQLQCEAFGQVPGKNARRVALLQTGKYAFDPYRGATEPFGRAVEPATQIADLVELIEQVEGDHPVSGVAQVGADLRDQMFAERARTGGGLFDAGYVFAGETAVARRPKMGFRAGIGEFEPAIAIAARGGAPIIGGVGRDIGGKRLRQLQQLAVRGSRPIRLVRRRDLFAVARRGFEQGVPLNLGLDKLRQFQVGKLQHLYCLLQLRRHDERLSLAQFEPLRKDQSAHKMLRLERLIG